MVTFSERLDDSLTELAWSLWTELGVRGAVRRHQDWSIDPEALIVLTAVLVEVDPRLRDESLDWCLRFHRYLSRSRLRNITGRLDDESAAAYRRFAGTLGAAGLPGWPKVEEPLPFSSSEKSVLADLRRPALLRLRLRAIFGVSARAELIHTLAWRHDSWLTIGDLAELSAYTKRNVSDELNGLELAGLLDVAYSGNRKRLRLADIEALRSFVGPAPSQIIDWIGPTLLLTEVRALARRFEAAAPEVQDVEASSLIASHSARPDIAPMPRLPELGPSAGDALERWALNLSGRLARGRDK